MVTEDEVLAVLQDASKPLSLNDILVRIVKKQLAMYRLCVESFERACAIKEDVKAVVWRLVDDKRAEFTSARLVKLLDQTANEAKEEARAPAA